MAEEKNREEEQTVTSEDLDMLRVLMHNVRGISPISTAVAFSDNSDADEE